MPQATRKSNTKSAPKLARADVKRSAPVDAFLAGTADTTTKTTDHTKSFDDVMVELGIGAEILIDRLDKAFDAGFELDMDVSGDVMDAILAAQWIAQRLSEDISKVGYEFDGSRSDRGDVDFAQAAE